MKLLWTVIFSVLMVMPVVAQEPAGQRILGIDINTAENEDYDTAFILACQAGMGTLGISLDWVDFEPEPMVYDSTILEIMNIYYPIFDMPVDLTIRPIHTHTLRVPDDLRDVRFDDPRMLERFTDLLDFIFATTPDVRYNSLVIGSEFDSYLGSDAQAWQDYTLFAHAVRDYIRETYSTDVPVVYEMIYSSLVGDTADYAQTLNAGSRLWWVYRIILLLRASMWLTRRLSQTTLHAWSSYIQTNPSTSINSAIHREKPIIVHKKNKPILFVKPSVHGTPSVRKSP